MKNFIEIRFLPLIEVICAVKQKALIFVNICFLLG
jgi:hypothetical protein